MHGLQPCGALVACGRRLFLQAISASSLAVQQLILSAFIDVNFGESVVCFFQLADIVDFLLTLRPYGFIV